MRKAVSDAMKNGVPALAVLRLQRQRDSRGVRRWVAASAGVAISLSLAACAPRPAAPIYCVTPEQYEQLKRAEPPKVGKDLTGQAQDDLKIIAGNNVELRQYGRGLLGVIGGCVGN